MLFKINTKDLKDIKEGLVALCSDDNDMNGENGDEFLWEEAVSYPSNADYLAAISISNNETVQGMFEYFVETWMSRDGYYTDYNLEFLEDEREDELIVSFIITHED